LDESHHEGVEVGHEIIVLEVSPSYLGLDEGLWADTELDQAQLGLLDLLYDLVGGDEGATLGVGHQTFWTKDSSVSLESGDKFRGTNNLVEVDDVILDVCKDLIIADNICSNSLELLMEFIVSKNAYSDLLTGSRWENTSSSNHLVTFCWIDIELDNCLHGLGELPFFGVFLNLFEDLFGLVYLG